MQKRLLLLELADLLEVARVKSAQLGVLVILGAKTVLHPQAEHGFDLAELFALETGGAVQHFAELEEIERRHRLEHVDLVIEQLPDLDHALEAMHDHVHVGAVIIRGRFAQHFAGREQLMQDLFEPKLVGLVHDDEEHFIVRDELAFLEAERLLQFEQPLDPEVIAVILQLTRAAVHRAFHRRAVSRTREDARQCTRAPSLARVSP